MLRSRKGFSLIEVMVVVAIIGILAGLSVAAYGQIGTASAPRNAINDLSSTLIRARTMASENQTDIWFIIYPTSNSAGATGATPAGHGAYFLYEDKAGTFNSATGPSSTEVYYQSGAGGISFVPTAAFGSSTNLEGRLIDKNYLDDYAGKNVIFKLPSGGITMGAADAPFNGLVVAAAGCTFCSGNPSRGAIVFGPDGSARFVGGDGTPVVATGVTSVARAHAIGLMNTSGSRVYVVAVSGPTAFIGTFDKKL